jgi:HAD superfamily hydrolase (TIGR01549 family)
VGAVARRPRSSSARGAALTSDVWYTLIYLPRRERRRVEAARRAIWESALVGTGLTRADAGTAWHRLVGWTKSRARSGRAPSTEAQAAWLTEHTARGAGLSAVPERLDALIAGAHIEVAPGADAALRELREAGIRLGIVSDLVHESSGAVRRRLTDLGLLQHFGAVQFSPDLPWSKPDPRPFRVCLGLLGVSPADAVHVGDLAHDVVGARLAGERPILFTGLHRWEVDARGHLAGGWNGGGARASSWTAVARMLLRGR